MLYASRAEVVLDVIYVKSRYRNGLQSGDISINNVPCCRFYYGLHSILLTVMALVQLKEHKTLMEKTGIAQPCP
jgi:hypothetical protein